MTKTELTSALSDLGYTLDTWTDLRDYSMVFLDQDPRVWVSPDTRKIKFNTTTSLMEIAEGYTDKNGNFICYTGTNADGSYVPSVYYAFSNVVGFVRTSRMNGTSYGYSSRLPFQQVKTDWDSYGQDISKM
jgi:hypothetical protein